MWGNTIAAIATPWGEGGIAVIRLSGPDAWDFASRRIVTVSPTWKARQVHYGSLHDEDDMMIDQILLLPFRGPSSYTGEDSVEIHCHGGSLIAQRCLELMISAGARQALPGEFTRRAFENGRLDLSQAEAVAALIHARSNEALRAASRSLKGELSRAVAELRDDLLALSAEVEVGLDFPDEDVPLIDDNAVAGQIEILLSVLADLKERCASGMILREGVRVVLAGRPNAGKSSLLNALLKEARSIVTAIPGTTRDIVEAVLTCRGIPLRLVDTAGLGETSRDEVEAIGMTLASRAIKEADVRLWVHDASRAIDPQDEALMADASHSGLHVFVLNKSDLQAVVTEDDLLALFPGSPVVSISAKENRGLEQLKELVVSLIHGSRTVNDGLNANARQIGELSQLAESLGTGLAALQDGLGQGTLASCLAEGRNAMDRILGVTGDDELLHAVFSRFCVGK